MKSQNFLYCWPCNLIESCYEEQTYDEYCDVSDVESDCDIVNKGAEADYCIHDKHQNDLIEELSVAYFVWTKWSYVADYDHWCNNLWSH